MPITHSSFKPAWWCRNPHLQTLWPLSVKPPHPRLNRERIELPDGDFIDLHWTTNPAGPRVLVMHGLEGSAHSHYARRILHVLNDNAMRGVLLHFRGRSGEPNRLPRAYHSGETGDLDYVVNLLRRREPRVPLSVIGYSLGGNVLLKWLGEKGDAAPVSKAVAVSVPFVLSDLADHMNVGFARLYQHYLLKSLHRTFLAKAASVDLHMTAREISDLRSFWEFDDKVTAPLHGFTGAADYYRQSSSRQFLKHIRIPTLVIQSRDDPFMTEKVLPTADELSDNVNLELSRYGGHVGFLSGGTLLTPKFWLEPRILSFLDASDHPGNTRGEKY